MEFSFTSATFSGPSKSFKVDTPEFLSNDQLLRTKETKVKMSDQQTEAKAHLKEHGWVRIPSVLSTDEAAHALDRLWQAKAASEAQGEETRMSWLDPNASNIRVFYLMALDKLFRDLISHPKAIDMVKSVLGENFLIANFTANIARPGSQSMALHSDQSIVFPDPWRDIWALNVIWCKHTVPHSSCWYRDF